MDIPTHGKKPVCIFQYRKQRKDAVILVIGDIDYEKNKETSRAFRRLFPNAYYILVLDEVIHSQHEQVDYTELYHVVLDIDVCSFYALHPSCVLTHYGLLYIYNTFFKEFGTDLIIKINSGTLIPPLFNPITTLDSKRYNFLTVYGDVLDNMVLDSAIFTIPVFELKSFIDAISIVIHTCSNTVLCAETTYRGIIPFDKIKLHSR
jgi:hypothetical protein